MDILPTHGFSDYPLAYLHGLLCKVKTVEAIAWNWFVEASFFALIFWILSKLIGVIASAILLFICPGFAISSGDIQMGHIAFSWLLIVASLNEKYRLRSFFAQIILNATFFYYPALGVPIILSGLFTLGLHNFLLGNKFKKIVFRLSLPIIVLIAITALASLIRTGSLISIYQWIEFLKIQAQSMSYARFLNDNKFQTWIMYRLQPLTFVFLGTLAFWQLLKNKKIPSKKIYLFLFFTTTAFAINFNRYIQRHCIIEGFRIEGLWSLFPLVVLFIYAIFQEYCIFFYPIERRISIGKNTWITIAVTLGLVTTSFREMEAKIPHADKKNWSTYEARVKSEGEPVELINALRIKLKPKQTFYDFSNSPSLYVALGVPFPTFIIPTLYHTSQITQKKVLDDLNILHNNGNLPIVIYARGGNSEWDEMDGVPTAMRSFLVASWIHQHYAPCQTVSKYDIWCEIQEPELSSTLYRGVLYPKMLPGIWGSYDRGKYEDVSVPGDRLIAPAPTERDGLVVTIEGCSPNAETIEIKGETAENKLLPLFEFPLLECNEQSSQTHRVWLGMSSIAYAADLRAYVVSAKKGAQIKRIVLQREIP